MTRLAKMKVTGKLIANALAFPDDANIVFIKMERPGIFCFYVEHPSFPELPIEMPLPEVILTFDCDYNKRPSTWIKNARLEFIR